MFHGFATSRNVILPIVLTLLYSMTFNSDLPFIGKRLNWIYWAIAFRFCQLPENKEKLLSFYGIKNLKN